MDLLKTLQNCEDDLTHEELELVLHNTDEADLAEVMESKWSATPRIKVAWLLVSDLRNTTDWTERQAFKLMTWYLRRCYHRAP